LVVRLTQFHASRHERKGLVAEAFGSGSDLYSSFFFGWRPGCIGETSGFLLVLGGLYLLYRGYITWHIPVSLLGTIGVLTWIFGGAGYMTGDPLLALLSGGAILGALYGHRLCYQPEQQRRRLSWYLHRG
jgi:electron transport complex protein RnfD